MNLTEFGKVVRKARIDADVTLTVMALDLDTTASFLSAIETGRKKIPEKWVSMIETYFLKFSIYLRLGMLADLSNQCVSIKHLSPARMMLVAKLAHTELDDAVMDELSKLLNQVQFQCRQDVAAMPAI